MPVSAFRQYFDVFGPKANWELYDLALAKHGHFTASKTSPSRNYPDWRRSTVIYDDQLASVAARLEQEVGARLPEILETLMLPRFDIGSFEVQLTSHNDGEYYKWHTDSGTRQTASRIVTFVYYFHGIPKRFTGGELVIFQPDGEPLVVEPCNDSLVCFSSRMKHEVRPVVCPSRRFEDGRFTLNGWVRKRTVARDDGYFGYRIFAPRGSSARLPVPGLAHARRSPPAPTDDPRARVAADAKLESLLDLYGELHRLSAKPRSIDVARRMTRRRFHESYYCRNRPVILKNMLVGSRALKRWSPEFFARNFRSVPVQVTAGRESDPDYERNFRRSVTTTTMGEFIERLTNSPATNDFYLVARNYFFANPEFQTLRDDLMPPAEIIDTTDQSPGSAKLWLGPKGTVTPLHHDEHSILFAQVYGQKHFKLIPSFDLPKLYVRGKFYSAVDPENIDAVRHAKFLSASVADVILKPGDMLFIPAGWWHWVKSLDISISATFSSFHVPGRNTQWKSG